MNRRREEKRQKARERLQNAITDLRSFFQQNGGINCLFSPSISNRAVNISKLISDGVYHNDVGELMGLRKALNRSHWKQALFGDVVCYPTEVAGRAVDLISRLLGAYHAMAKYCPEELDAVQLRHVQVLSGGVVADDDDPKPWDAASLEPEAMEGAVQKIWDWLWLDQETGEYDPDREWDSAADFMEGVHHILSEAGMGLPEKEKSDVRAEGS